MSAPLALFVLRVPAARGVEVFVGVFWCRSPGRLPFWRCLPPTISPARFSAWMAVTPSMGFIEGLVDLRCLLRACSWALESAHGKAEEAAVVTRARGARGRQEVRARDFPNKAHSRSVCRALSLSLYLPLSLSHSLISTSPEFFPRHNNCRRKLNFGQLVY